MKNTLFTLILLCFALFGFSQGKPCTISNDINSGSVVVDLYASPAGSCLPGCVVQSICLFPGETKVILPCGPDFFEWSLAVVTPTTDECSTPCPGGVTVVSPTNCAPQFDFDFHCHANSLYISVFVDPITLEIS